MDDVVKGRIRLALLALALLLLAGAGIGLALPVYRNWKQQRLLAQAQAFLAKGDYPGSSLFARQVLSLNPSNLVACQLMAGLAEKAGSPALLDWRQRIAQISPTPENRLLLASTALRFQRPPYPLTTQALDDLRADATNLPAFHAVSAELALRLKELDAAQVHFQAAARLEPTNELHRLNLAALRLASTNAALAAESRTTLESLRQSPNLGAVALGWLVEDGLRRKDLAAAAAWSAQLVAHPRCTTQQRLQHLEFLLPGKGPEFTSYLDSLKQRAVTNVSEVRSLSTWLIQRHQADEALCWLTNLPPAVRAQQPVPLATTEAYAALKDWTAVQGFLASQRWGDLEFMRLAFLSQASAQRRETVASSLWRSAVREAGERLGALWALLNLADSWQRRADTEDLLWRIYQRFPGQRWTLRDLAHLYQADGDTRGLNKLFGVLAGLDPKDYRARNNLATTSLLLKLNLTKTYEQARDLHTERPDDAIIASTYAFALHLRGSTREGLAVFQSLKPEALEEPPIALYYGVLLSAANQTERARKYLDLGQGAALLPEEKALLEVARRAL